MDEIDVSLAPTTPDPCNTNLRFCAQLLQSLTLEPPVQLTVILCADGAVFSPSEDTGDPRLAPFQTLAPRLPWGTENLALFAETEAETLAPGLYFACLPTNDDGRSGLALFGQTIPWSEPARAALSPFAPLLSGALAWRTWSQKCAMLNWTFNQIMDTMNVNIFVSDVETGQIIFMNQTMKNTFHYENPEGEICWKLLQKGMTGRCPFCTIPRLLDAKDGNPSCVWEEFSVRTGRTFENHDYLMTWVDGRQVHIQQSSDITESKRLYNAATLDDLTGILNRGAGRSALKELLDKAAQAGEIVTVAMLDIDELKILNETHGHRMGDALVLSVSSALRSVLTPQDCLFRVGGDEFIAALRGCGLNVAHQKLRAAQAKLDREHPLPASFCYGLLQLPPNHGLLVPDILGAVDERLYEQKRLDHIRKAERKLRENPVPALSTKEFHYDANLLYDALIQSTDDYIYVCNMKTGIFRYDPAMVEEFGLPAQVIENAAAVWGSKIHAEDKTVFLESNQEITDGRTNCHCVEYRAKNRKGEWVWLRCRGHLIRDEDGTPALFAGFITNQDKKHQIDRLTGLWNKNEFESELSRLTQECHRPVTTMIFGVDDLRHVNSLHDHTFGDEVIRIAAQKIQSMLPASACAFRLDGDTFGVLISGDDPVVSTAFYRRVQAAFSHQQTYGGRKFFCTLSAGCVFSPQDGTLPQQLIKCGHFALERAKQLGKNQLCCFSPDLLRIQERLLDLTELLRESVENQFSGFELHFQPIFKGENHGLNGAEALCRWHCDKYGNISPLEFIPLLEESGLILPVGRWIFRKAVETSARWQKLYDGFIMGINLSNLQLEDPTFIDFMEQVLTESGVNPAQIIVELTETYLASNVSALSDYLGRLRNMNVKISMDDFGTGYSSLSVLKQYPIDVVKIDRTFVHDILSSPFESAFIQLVVELCHKLDIGVCLEGVETLEELNVVQPLHLNFFQGFYFGRPMPAVAFETQILNQLTPST